MTDTNSNVSGLTDASLDDLTITLDNLEFSNDEVVLEAIDELLEGAGDESVVEETLEPEVVEVILEAAPLPATELAAEIEELSEIIASAGPAVEVPADVTPIVPVAAKTADILDDLDLGVISQEELDAIEAKAERQAIYEAQASGADTTLDEAAAEAVAPVASVRAAKTPKAPKAPKAVSAKAVKDIATIDPLMFVLENGAVADLDANRADVLAKRPTQLKIAEKFDNLFGSLAVEKKPSVYVMTAFQALSMTGVITSTEIAAAFKATGHTDGTANSQAGQIMVLFDTVKVATRAKNTLTLNSASIIAERLRTVASKAVSA